MNIWPPAFENQAQNHFTLPGKCPGYFFNVLQEINHKSTPSRKLYRKKVPRKVARIFFNVLQEIKHKSTPSRKKYRKKYPGNFLAKKVPRKDKVSPKKNP